jgi:diguanylate cyclase (GGDEF)-like protein
MVGRYGGEEFLVILNRCDASSVLARAEHLRASIGGKSILARENTLAVTVSVGLVRSTDYQNREADDIIQEADRA